MKYELLVDGRGRTKVKDAASVREWLAKVRPDVVVLVYNDHGLNFFLDKMPTFAIGAAREYRNADEGWGIPTTQPFQGDPELSWHLIEQLVHASMRIESGYAIELFQSPAVLL